MLCGIAVPMMMSGECELCLRFSSGCPFGNAAPRAWFGQACAAQLDLDAKRQWGSANRALGRHSVSGLGFATGTLGLLMLGRAGSFLIGAPLMAS